jgi:hypothetical protein
VAKSGKTIAARSPFGSPLAPGGATNPASSPFATGQVSPIYALGGGGAGSSAGIPAFSSSGATGASSDGTYLGGGGVKRNADGSKAVGGATLAARNKSAFSNLSTGTKIAIVGGAIGLVVVFYLYRKVTAPARYLNHVTNAVKGVHKAVTGG